MKHLVNTLVFFALSICLWVPDSQAEDSAGREVLETMIEAYGGDTLKSLPGLRVYEDLANIPLGQGYTPDFDEIGLLRRDVRLDFTKGRGSVETLIGESGDRFVSRIATVNDSIVEMDYDLGIYVRNAAPSYIAAFGVSIRLSDTLLVHRFATDPVSRATHVGEEVYLGRPIVLFDLELDGLPPMRLHVDKEAGWVRKVTRSSPVGRLAYVFSEFARQEGIGFAREMAFYAGDRLRAFTRDRKVTPGVIDPTIFSIDEGLAESKGLVDMSSMTADRVAENVYLIGRGGTYGAFYDAGDHAIAVNLAPGLGDRFEAYRKVSGKDHSLRYLIMTHHHGDRLAGAVEAFDLGVIFVAPKAAVNSLRETLVEPLPDERLVVLDDRHELGPLEIHVVPSVHSLANALVFHRASQTLFSADHFTVRHQGELLAADQSGVELASIVDGLKLDVTRHLSSHSPRTATSVEFRRAVAAYKPTLCPGNRPICQD